VTLPNVIFGEPWLDHLEEELVVEVLRSGWLGQGGLVERFEREFAEYVGCRHVVAVSSCTAALHLSLVALGIGSGDEVVTTPFTFVATVNAIEHTGATPVLVDPESESRNLAPAAAEAALSERTRAVMPVHFGGWPLDVDGYARLAEDHDLWIVEDAAHAVGGVASSRRVGGSRHARVLSCFSFYPNKNLTSAEGGVVCTEDDDLAERLRELRLHGLSSDAWARYKDPHYRPSLATAAGFKANWTDLQAAIALPQLEKLEGFLAIREYLAERFDELLDGIPGVRVLERPRPSLSERHALHLYQVEIEGPAGRRDDVLRRLRSAGIGAAVHYIGINRHPFYAPRYTTPFPVSDWASDALLSLPLHPRLDERSQLLVAGELAKAVRDA
jgi:dTDP-4-amino-4,6-dideoxygalactose transaminase